MRKINFKFLFILTISLWVGTTAYKIYFPDNSLIFPTVNQKVEQPLARLIINPQIFYDRKLITSGYLKFTEFDGPRLFFNKEDAENNLKLNSILLRGFLDKEKDKDVIEEYDLSYVRVEGIFTNILGELALTEVKTLPGVDAGA